LPSPWRRRVPAPLPESLRDRLLAIPESQPSPRSAQASSIGDLGSTWLLASPLAPIAASFLIVFAVSLLLGNPYQAGAATLSGVREEVSPAAGRLREGVSRIAGVAAGMGELAAGALPRAGLGASRVIAQTLQEHVDEGERQPALHPEPAR
jgi:hypothetical protein